MLVDPGERLNTMGDAGGIFLTPPPPPKSASPPRILIVGAGSRGQTYARSVTSATVGIIVAVAEPDAYRRHVVGTECRSEERRVGTECRN